MFGHRSLQPIIDLQEQLRRRSASPSASRTSSPPPTPCSTSSTRVDGRRALRRVRRRDHQPDVKLGEIVEIGAVKVQGGKIADRWSTLVKPGRPIVGSQLHGITDKDVEKAPRPDKAVADFLDLAGDALAGRPQRRLRPRLPRGRASPTATERAGPLSRHARPRPRGVSRPGRLQAGRAGRVLRARAAADATAPCPTRRRPPSCSSASATTCPARVKTLQGRRRRLHPDARKRRRRGRSGRRARRRQGRLAASKGLTGLLHKKIVRELVLNEGIRMDGRDLDTIRPISVEVGLLPRAHGSALFTRGETQALTVATLGPSSDVQRIDTIGPEESKALPPPLQLAALQHRREQADARPRPARHRPRRARRAGAHPGAAVPRGVPVRHPPRDASA